ncbi:hypothetical protein TWF730_005274 [Orbilia blumenaviensis]|uniref:Exonuclease V n=1 Tax=Orbilia blumenaviensis TaxID=1796055 RepID=A0AAV9VKB0_9PEZI
MMSPGTPATAAASRPNRRVFRPFDGRSSTSGPSNTTPALIPPPPPPQVQDTGEEESSQTSTKSQDYGIDFELDDDDAGAIEEVFAEFEKKLKQSDGKQPIAAKTIPIDKNSLATTRSFEPLLPSQPTQYSSGSSVHRVRIVEEEEGEEDGEPAGQGNNNDTLALDALLDWDFDDAELLAGIASRGQPNPQNNDDEGKGKQKADGTWDSQENWHDEEVDQQVLWEYEQWVKRTGYVETPGKTEEIVDESPQAKAVQEEEKKNQQKYQDALDAGLVPDIEDANADTRPPLERWRSRGGNTKLSVSDLLFNTWCEQQYHYSLLRGFKRRTVEMKAGTKIHREKEEEVHTVVPVTIKTKNDRWGLKIWNMIQGLESLRAGGLTRELEVWGWLDGVFVNGIIDEVSLKRYERERDEKENSKVGLVGDRGEEKVVSLPENVTEAIVMAAAPTENKVDGPPETPKKKRGRPRKTPEPTSPGPQTPKQQQKSILDYMTPSPKKTRSKGQPAYVLDLKTRASSSIPKPGSSQSLAVHIQLMLYRHLLNDMLKATPKSMVKKLCKHHDLSADEPFSDDLIAGLAGDGIETELSSDELSLLLDNNSIEKLYTLFQKKLKQTISIVEPELTVVYRWQKDGQFMDSVNYVADDEMLKKHLDSVISWWKGQRETVGVPIEEAWKCKQCEFVDNCQWIQRAMEERRAQIRERRSAAV